MGITLDANRVIFPTQRRFNAAWQEMSGGKVRLLPQVASELTHHRLDLDHLEDQAHRARAALRRAENTATRRELLLRRSDLWWAEELLRDDGVYGLISMTRPQHERANAICDAIDARAFPNVRRDEVPTHSDAIINAWMTVPEPEALLEATKSRLPHKMRASERRHPAMPRKIDVGDERGAN